MLGGWIHKPSIWPACFLPFPADVNEENRIQLAQRYELHVGWMNAKSQVFTPLAGLDYQSDAFEKRSIALRCRYVEVHIFKERTTAKSGDMSPREGVAARHGESPPADRRVTGGNTSGRKGGRCRKWRSSDCHVTCENTSRRKEGRCCVWRSSDALATGKNTSRRTKMRTAEATQCDKRFFGKRTTE